MKNAMTQILNSRTALGAVPLAMLLSLMWAPAASAREVTTPGSADAAQTESATLDAADGRRVAHRPHQRIPDGGLASPGFQVSGRNRLEVRFGAMSLSDNSSPVGTAAAGSRASDLMAGGQYTRFLSEKLAVTLTANVLASEVGTGVSRQGVFAGSVSIVAVPLGIQWNPMKGEQRDRSVKPYLAVGLGPVIGASTGAFLGTRAPSFAGDQTRGTIGGHLGGGLDLHLSRRWVLGLSAGYNWMANFSEPVGARDNYNGLGATVSLGFLFGKGGAPRQ